MHLFRSPSAHRATVAAACLLGLLCSNPVDSTVRADNAVEARRAADNAVRRASEQAQRAEEAARDQERARLQAARVEAERRLEEEAREQHKLAEQKRIAELVRVSKALDKDAELEFHHTPFDVAIQFLSDIHKIPIELDEDALRKAGVETNKPVNLELKGFKLRSVLDLLAERDGMRVVVKGAVVKIEPTPPPVVEGDALRRATAARIEAALDKKTEIEFIDTPLSDAFDFLGDLHNIPIVFDERGLSDLKIDKDQPINKTLSNVTLESALEILLEPLKLTWVVEDEVMKITSIENMERKLSQRIYAVSSIDDEKTLERFADVLTAVVDPPSWDEQGGPGAVRVFGGKLIVLQNARAHRKIADLIEKLHPQHE